MMLIFLAHLPERAYLAVTLMVYQLRKLMDLVTMTDPDRRANHALINNLVANAPFVRHHNSIKIPNGVRYVGYPIIDA